MKKEQQRIGLLFSHLEHKAGSVYVDDFHQRLVVVNVRDLALALLLRCDVLEIVNLEIGTQLGEENVHASADGVVVFTPDLLEDDLAGDKLVLMVQQKLEKLGLLARECTGNLRVNELHAAEIEGEVAHLVDLFLIERFLHCRTAFSTLQDGTHTQLQLLDAERLGHIVVATQFETFDALLFGSL